MADKYWLTFRIAEVGNYGARYQALENCIQEMTGAQWWKEPTSFYAFNSVLDIDGVAAAVGGAINRRYDVALIGRIGYKSYRLVGGSDPDVRVFFPEVQ
jgi:hypothetical protein